MRYYLFDSEGVSLWFILVVEKEADLIETQY